MKKNDKRSVCVQTLSITMFAQALSKNIPITRVGTNTSTSTSTSPLGYVQRLLQLQLHIKRFKPHSPPRCRTKLCHICSQNRIISRVVFSILQQMSDDQLHQFCKDHCHLGDTICLVLSAVTDPTWQIKQSKGKIIDMMDLQVLIQQMPSWYQKTSLDTIIRLNKLCNLATVDRFSRFFRSESDLRKKIADLSLPVSPGLLDVISDEVMYIKQLPDKLEVPNLHYNYKMRRNGYKSQFPQLDLINIRRHIVPATRRYNSRRLQSLAFKLQVKDILSDFVDEDGIIRIVFSYLY